MAISQPYRLSSNRQTRLSREYVRRWTEPPKVRWIHERHIHTRPLPRLPAGLATGDALGTALEFKQPGTFTPIDDMIGRGRSGFEARQWTDDTSMALCLATSLIETGGFDPLDQMQRYVRWFREGYMSSTGECFDIGEHHARRAVPLRTLRRDPFAGSTNPNAAGNGSLMRLAPVPMRHAVADPKRQSTAAPKAPGPPTEHARRSTRAGTLPAF